MARLLATSILVFLLLAVGACLAQLHLAPDILAIMPLVGVGALVGVVAFFMAHTRHYRLAALTIAADLILVCVVAIQARPLDPVFEGMITCAVIFASVFLPLGQLVTVAVFAVLATMLGALTVPELREAGYHFPIIVYQLLAVSLLLLARGHRDRMEQARRDVDSRLSRELAASRRMETVGRLAGNVAHDFNNLLMVISTNTNLLAARAELGPDQRGLLDEIVAATDRAAQVTGQLLTLGRQQSEETRTIDLVAAVSATETLLRRALGSTVELRMTLCDGPLPVAADEGQIGQVLLNLLVNARDALPDGGVIRVDLHRLSLDQTMAREAGVESGNYAALRVVDNGLGMSGETMERAFEPFYTDRADGSGTGLGLASVYAIASSCGGGVRLDSAKGAGTTVHILLPLAAEHMPSTAVAPAAAPARILVVDDDPVVRVCTTQPEVRASIPKK